MSNKAKEQEFIQVIQANAGIIYKVIRLYVNTEEDQKDLYQEVLYQCWKSYASFEGNAKFSTWLYRVSLNTALTFQRSNRKRPVYDNLENASDQPARVSDYKDEAEQLLEAIRSLLEVDRIIISLHLDGYENDEIAEITGLTKNHVAVKLHRIKQELMKNLKVYGYGPA